MTTQTSPIRLHSERLSVDIARPGAGYQGARFDWSSFITQVTLDGTHTFCAAEGTSGSDKGVKGAGLCCEFGPQTAVAFSQAAPGERFLKPGVGLLTRPDAAPYRFFASYDVEPFDIDTETKTNAVVFTIQPRLCIGYAMRLVRRIEVQANQLRMTVHLENTGKHPIATEEYCHNFISINGHGPGPELSLTTGFSFAHNEARRIVQIKQNTATWDHRPQQPFFLPGGQIQRSPGTYWMLKHEPSGVGMAESGSFAMNRFALWGSGHVVSPEVFAAIHVRPGESQSWHREFAFFKPGDSEPCVNVESSPCEPQVVSVSLPHSGSRRPSSRVSAG